MSWLPELDPAIRSADLGRGGGGDAIRLAMPANSQAHVPGSAHHVADDRGDRLERGGNRGHPGAGGDMLFTA